MQNKPLQGVKVIDLSVFASAASCARLLGEWGAEVIKVEALNGDPGRYAGASLGLPACPEENPSFECNNAYKKGLALNLKSEAGKKIMNQLLADSHVFLTNNRTKALVRLGLDYDTIHNKFPHLIWAQLTGFGIKGADADDAGFDPVAFWARNGAMLDIAEADTAPVIPPTGFGDRTTGCSLAAGICAALYQQKVSGEGQRIQVSLMGQALWNLGEIIQSIQYGDIYPKSRKEAVTPLVNSYRCSDGKWIFISCYDYNRYFPLLCEVFGRNDLVLDERYSGLKEAKKHCKELIEIIEKEFSKYSEEEISIRLRDKDFPFSPINHISDVLKDQQALANGFLFQYEHRNGKLTQGVSSPVQFLNTNSDTYKNAPLLGEDGKEILRSFGYSDFEIEQLIEEKCIFIEQY